MFLCRRKNKKFFLTEAWVIGGPLSIQWMSWMNGVRVPCRLSQDWKWPEVTLPPVAPRSLKSGNLSCCPSSASFKEELNFCLFLIFLLYKHFFFFFAIGDTIVLWGQPVVKNFPANAGDARDMASISGMGRSLGAEHGNSLQYSCWRIPMDRGAWRATVHGVAKSWPWLEWLNTHTQWGKRRCYLWLLLIKVTNSRSEVQHQDKSHLLPD